MPIESLSSAFGHPHDPVRHVLGPIVAGLVFMLASRRLARGAMAEGCIRVPADPSA